MPIYEFECVPKGHIFDRLQKLSDPDPELCELCGEGPIRRRVTAPSFRLAGSGWYETDFKGDKDKRRNLAGDSGAEGNSTSEGKSDAKGEGKSDSKAESKSDSKADAPASTASSSGSTASGDS